MCKRLRSAFERARTSRDFDFVKRQVDSLLNTVAAAVEKIPDATEKSLLAKIGTGDRQVLAPLQRLITDVAKSATDKINELSLSLLFSGEIDPRNESTTLGKALRLLRDLLDPTRTDSIQGVLTARIAEVTSGEGALAKAVKQVVADAMQPLSQRVDSLAKEICGQKAVAEALAQTTEKGIPYEISVVSRLQTWSNTIGAEIAHVGGDNKPGDILITVIAPEDLSLFNLVVEVRDR